mgnify:CR=1 FL=1
MTTYSHDITVSASEFASILEGIAEEIKYHEFSAIGQNALIQTMIKGFDKDTRTYRFEFSDLSHAIIQKALGKECFYSRLNGQKLTSTSSFD